MPTRRHHTVALGLLCAMLATASAQDDASWIEALDPASGKKFYYHSKTRESSWEIPEGARVTYMEGGETGEGSASKRAKKDGTNSMWVLVGLLAPIVLPLLGLAACYWQATREGLAEALKELGKRRERARKRRGSKAGGSFKQRQKLSQDGKGGRSANS